MFKIFFLFPLSIVYKSFLLEWQRASFSNATWTSFCRPFKWIWVVYLSGYNFIHCFLPLSHQTFFLYIFILVWCSWSKSCYVFCHLFSPFLNCVRSLRLTRTTLSSIAGCSSNEMIAAVSEVQINVENTVENDQVLFFFFAFSSCFSIPISDLILLFVVVVKCLFKEIRKKAISAYNSFIRAYTIFPKALKIYFTVRALHLGHIAR